MTKANPAPLYDPDHLPATTEEQIALVRDILLGTEYVCDLDTFDVGPVYAERVGVYMDLLQKIEKHPALYDLLPLCVTRYRSLSVTLGHIAQHAPSAAEKLDYVNLAFSSLLNDLPEEEYYAHHCLVASTQGCAET